MIAFVFSLLGLRGSLRERGTHAASPEGIDGDIEGYRRDLYSDNLRAGQHPSLNRQMHVYTHTHTLLVSRTENSKFD